MSKDDLEHNTPFLKFRMEEEEGGELLNFVKKEARFKYGSNIPADILEDMVQDTVVVILENAYRYDENIGNMEQFIKFYTDIGLSKSYQEYIDYKTGKKISSYVRKQHIKLKKYIEEGMSIKEIAAIEHMKESTVLNLINAGLETKSLDSCNENGKNMYDILSFDIQNDDNCNKSNDDKVEKIIKLLGISEPMEKYIIEVYLSNTKLKNWKKKTIDICAERGITKKKVVDSINKYRNQLKDYKKTLKR